MGKIETPETAAGGIFNLSRRNLLKGTGGLALGFFLAPLMRGGDAQTALRVDVTHLAVLADDKRIKEAKTVLAALFRLIQSDVGVFIEFVEGFAVARVHRHADGRGQFDALGELSAQAHAQLAHLHLGDASRWKCRAS